VKVVLFSCSEYEAHNYGMTYRFTPTLSLIHASGRFLLGILSDMDKWHADEQLYNTDNRSKVSGIVHPGFRRNWINKPAPPDTILEWGDFLRVMRKWHKKLGKVNNLSRSSSEWFETFYLRHLLSAYRQGNLCMFTMPLLS
jgi:THO complex subunit 2